MKAVILTQGKIAVVDDDDFERVSQFKWYAAKTKKTHRTRWEARRHLPGTKPKVQQRLHDFILGCSPVDHIDHDTLNNCRSNLRACTHVENMRNSRIYRIPNKRSKFKGVSTLNGRWSAQIRVNKKLIYLGGFDDECEAAKAYDQAAIKHFGAFAATNAQLLGGQIGLVR